MDKTNKILLIVAALVIIGGAIYILAPADKNVVDDYGANNNVPADVMPGEEVNNEVPEVVDEGNTTGNILNRQMFETYISQNISELSPEAETLGGTFYVTNFEWRDEENVLVTYEDGHVAYVAEVNLSVNADGQAVVDSFVVTTNTTPMIEEEVAAPESEIYPDAEMMIEEPVVEDMPLVE